jgi:DNA-binding FadR family transcriptional regulator
MVFPAHNVLGTTGTVRVPKTAELVASHIRQQIIRGQLKEGDALPAETVLMAQLGISRPTLREAFRILESEALISVRRGVHGGARVHVPSEEVAARYAAFILRYRGVAMADVYAARTILEAPAAGMLASRSNSVTLAKRLERYLTESETATETASERPWAAAGFHQLVVELAGNQTLTLFSTMLESLFEAHNSKYIREHDPQPTEQHARRGERAHYKLVELVRAGDAVEAEAHWRRHLSELSREMIRSTEGATVIDVLG